jgi:lipid II:glycine glycyltransferase (peptidoglycan interpeptide bridge formation enzyme)
VYEEGCYTIALPLLLRAVEQVPGLEQSGIECYDATSVYGYAGPLTSHPEVPPEVIRNFQCHLAQEFQKHHIVAAFSRLHPLFPQQRALLDGLGECVALSSTVAIDLTLPLDQQRALYRSNHKRDINKLRRQGVTCVHGTTPIYLDALINIYHETMRRVDAVDSYFFERDYFEQLVDMLGTGGYIFVCCMDDTPICAGLFTLMQGIVQYHLGGTRTEFLPLAPSKLLFDTVRLWANEQSAQVLHLGGGVGSREDSLFRFKAGFSDTRHEFAIWRWVVQPEAYHRLNTKREMWLLEQGLQPTSSSFFPFYRCAAIPAS